MRTGEREREREREREDQVDWTGCTNSVEQLNSAHDSIAS